MKHLDMNPEADPLGRDAESQHVQWSCHGMPVTEIALARMKNDNVRPLFCRGEWNEDEFTPSVLYIFHSRDDEERVNSLNERDTRLHVWVQRAEWYDIGWQDPSSGRKMYPDNHGEFAYPLMKYRTAPEARSMILTNLRFFCGMVAGKVGFAPITRDDELKITFPSPDDGQTFVDERTKLPMTMWEGIAWTQRGANWYTIEYGTKDGDIWWAQDENRTWLCLRDGVWCTRDAQGNWHAKQ